VSAWKQVDCIRNGGAELGSNSSPSRSWEDVFPQGREIAPPSMQNYIGGAEPFLCGGKKGRTSSMSKRKEAFKGTECRGVVLGTAGLGGREIEKTGVGRRNRKSRECSKLRGVKSEEEKKKQGHNQTRPACTWTVGRTRRKRLQENPSQRKMIVGEGEFWYRPQR